LHLSISISYKEHHSGLPLFTRYRWEKLRLPSFGTLSTAIRQLLAMLYFSIETEKKGS
jgi:uncharacterized membrane protein